MKGCQISDNVVKKVTMKLLDDKFSDMKPTFNLGDR